MAVKLSLIANHVPNAVPDRNPTVTHTPKPS